MSETESRKLMDRKQAAEYLGIKPQTLAAWACTGRYRLPFIKLGRTIRYRVADLDAFLAANTASSVGEWQAMHA